MLLDAMPNPDLIERFLFQKEHKDETRQNRWQKCLESYADAGVG